METNPYLAPEAPLDAAALGKESAPDNDISETELIAFAGKKHYPPLLLSLIEGKSRHAGFNFWAALFGIQWYFYRKLYLFGLFSLTLEFVVPLVPVWSLRYFFGIGDKGVLLAVVLTSLVISRIMVGYMANIALCLKAVKVIKEIDSQNHDNETHLLLIKNAGGVSVPSLILIYVVLSLVQMI